MGSALPINALNEDVARSMAEDMAATLVPQGRWMKVGDLVSVEFPARPFDRVVAQQSVAGRKPLTTYIFDVTTGSDRCVATYEGATFEGGRHVRCEKAAGHSDQHSNSFAARYWD